MATILSVASLTNPVSRAEVQASIYSILGRLGVNTTAWKRGAVVRTMIVGVSAVLSAFSQLMADIARSGFLELAEGPWLTLVARHVYGVERNTATFASGAVTLTNTAGGVYTFDPGDLIVINSTTGATYRNVAAVSLGALSTVTVQVAATVAGTVGNADPHQIDALGTALPGVDVDNAAAITGIDDEADAALRLRCAERLGALSPMGPWDAYAYAIRNSKRADGSPVAISRIRITKDGLGNVYVRCASPDGTVTPDDLDIATAAVDYSAAPLGVTAHVESAVANAINVTAGVYVYNTAGMTDTEIRDAIRDRLYTFFGSQPVGGNVIGTDPGKVFADGIRAAIAAAVAPYIFHVDLAVPTGDEMINPDAVATRGTVTITVTQVAPPEGYQA